jgi:2-amino-4-hydroxy-6-hydroxymethyldihydropteridine diphosphokinase
MALHTHSATVAFGANLGDRDTAIYEAMALLAAHSEISEFKASRLYRTKPVDATGPDFCNAAAHFKTALSAQALLALLLDIEQRLGRKRSTRNAPRIIDLDLIALDGQTLSLTELTLPHPRAHERAFVLIPLCEIASGVMLGPQDTSLQQPAEQWLVRLSEAQRQEFVPW